MQSLIRLLSCLLMKVRRVYEHFASFWWNWIGHKRNYDPEILIYYKRMDRGKEVISENVTRNIFTWLCLDGCAPHEKKIWDHEWFADLDLDSDEGAEDEDLSI